MEVILSQDVVNLGKAGEVVKVKDGFARNYLIPRQVAMAATKENLKNAAKVKAKAAELYEAERKAAAAEAEKLAKISCTITVEVNDQEKLYGAVSETEILNALELEGFKAGRHDLVLEKPVNELGIFEIGVKLHPDVTGKFRLWVTKK